jgi:hypothetical protein
MQKQARRAQTVCDDWFDSIPSIPRASDIQTYWILQLEKTASETRGNRTRLKTRDVAVLRYEARIHPRSLQVFCNSNDQSVSSPRVKRFKSPDHSLIYTDQVLVASSLAIAEGTKTISSHTNLYSFLSTQYDGLQRWLYWAWQARRWVTGLSVTCPDGQAQRGG